MKNIEEYFQWAQIFFQQKHYEQAKQSTEEVLKLEPNNIEARDNLIFIEAQIVINSRDLGKLEGFIPELKKSFDKFSSSDCYKRNMAQIYLHKASLLSKQEKFEDCKKALLEALEYDPLCTEVKEDLAEVLNKIALEGNGGAPLDNRKAIKYLVRAVAVDPNNPIFKKNLSVILTKEVYDKASKARKENIGFDIGEAKSILGRALELFPKNDLATYNLQQIESGFLGNLADSMDNVTLENTG